MEGTEDLMPVGEVWVTNTSPWCPVCHRHQMRAAAVATVLHMPDRPPLEGTTIVWRCPFCSGDEHPQPSATTESGQLCNTEATMSKGDNGSHWDGCEEAHHDCALAKLRKAEAEVAKWVQRTYDEQEAKLTAMQERDELQGEVSRLKAQCDRLALEGDQLQAAEERYHHQYDRAVSRAEQAEAALAERDKMLEDIAQALADTSTTGLRVVVQDILARRAEGT